MTVEEIYNGLGLDDPDVFIKKQRALNYAWWLDQEHKGGIPPDQQWRRTGRTTMMLVNALSWLANNEGKTVAIKGHCPNYSTNLMFIARDYAERLGIDPMRIVGRTQRPDRTFFDHYVREELGA